MLQVQVKKKKSENDASYSEAQRIREAISKTGSALIASAIAQRIHATEPVVALTNSSKYYEGGKIKHFGS